MSGITQKEIDSIRATQEQYFPDTLIIRRRVFIGPPDDWQVVQVGNPIPGRIHIGAFGQFRLLADRLQNMSVHTITMEWDTDIRTSDQIVDQDGRIFEVHQIGIANSINTACQVLADLVT